MLLKSSTIQCTLCACTATHTHTALDQDLTNGCCWTLVIMGFFPPCGGRTRCSRSAFISPDQGQAKVLPPLPPSQSSKKFLDHVSSGRAIKPTPTPDSTTPLQFSHSVQHVDADYLFLSPLQIIYNCALFKYMSDFYS